MLHMLGQNDLISLEDEIDFELGASAKKKKRGKVRKKLKKAFAVVATGGVAGAAMLGKKKKGKVAKKARAVVAKAKKVAAKAKTALRAPKASPAARTVARVQAKTAAQCCDKDELARLVTAQLVAKLGPPLDAANRVLALFQLQNTATYEHKKLMTDDNFRRQVLTKLARGAANGNASCERTIRVIMGR